MKPTLVVLAAGMGSRYGGLKQMDGLGPGGETIIDYSIYDAVHNGFGKVVYIVREYFLEQFRRAVAEKYGELCGPDGEKVEFAFVTQELGKIPEGFTLNPERQKPWGTAHAMYMAKDEVAGPFVVINGDDYYGRESFEIAGKWCRDHADSKGVYAIVGFELDKTLSESGGVSRGICHYNDNLELTDVVECHNIAMGADGVIKGDNSVTGENEVMQGKDLCSMNMWCFTPDYYDHCGELLKAFLKENSMELKKEFYIPFTVDSLIKQGTARCEVLRTGSKWFGVTFKEDRPGVVAQFARLAAEGYYPTPLYKK